MPGLFDGLTDSPESRSAVDQWNNPVSEAKRITAIFSLGDVSAGVNHVFTSSDLFGR
jgi:hypothetical protein